MEKDSKVKTAIGAGMIMLGLIVLLSFFSWLDHTNLF